MLAQRQRTKQQFYKNSNWKRLTQAEIENRLFPICLIQMKTIWDREKFKLCLKYLVGFYD